jgi:hypothetical protein
MTKEEFEKYLDAIADTLRNEACSAPFTTSKQFENRVREVVQGTISDPSIQIDFNPHPQAFPDIEVGEFGIEVKFTANDEWRSVANSVLETNRIESVKHVYIMFGKMGGMPDVRWGEYEKSVMHVRTSHVPRFEVQIGASKSLFDVMDISYDAFRVLDMHEKMRYIREYARNRLKEGERLWWLEDAPGEEHTLPIQARLFTELDDAEKIKLRAEAILLCPQIVKSGRAKHKYDDVALFMLTYHGVLCHQARDMFSAGSVGNPENDDNGGLYIARMLKLMEGEMAKAAMRMDMALFEEYWGKAVAPKDRIQEWLRRADEFADAKWIPSRELFDGRFVIP